MTGSANQTKNLMRVSSYNDTSQGIVQHSYHIAGTAQRSAGIVRGSIPPTGSCLTALWFRHGHLKCVATYVLHVF